MPSLSVPIEYFARTFYYGLGWLGGRTVQLKLELLVRRPQDTGIAEETFFELSGADFW